jgi:hypothetical protein
MTQLQLVTDGALTTPERTQLKTCEGRIEKGLATFIEVGTALLEIRDSRLYRETHSTFENYCRDRWQLQRKRAYHFIEAASVINNLSNSVSTIVDTEKVCDYDPTDQGAWERAAERERDRLEYEQMPFLPTKESQVRPLATLEPEVQREVWRDVVATTPPQSPPGYGRIAIGCNPC